MPRPRATAPTEAELEVLEVLWQAGPSTVRQVHNAVKDRRTTGYSTTLKIIQIMTDKGLLLKDDSVRPQIYRPAQPEEKTQLQLLDRLIQRGFGGSAMKLVMRALSAKRVTPEELAEARRLIDQSQSSSSRGAPP